MKELLKRTLSNDHLFKKVFDEEKYIAGLLIKLGIIDENYGMLVLERTEENEGINFKSSNMDLKVKVINEDDISYINVEMQNNKTKYNILDRLMLYLSKLVVRSQPKSATYHKNNCIVVGILNYTLFNDEIYLRTLQLKDSSNIVLSNYEIVLLELTKADFCDKKELRDWLEIFNAKDLEYFKKEPGIMKDLAEKLEKLNKDRIFQSYVDRAELEEMDRRTQTFLEKKEAREEGLAEGRAQGLAEGRAEGKAQGLAEGKAEGLEVGKSQALFEVAIKMKQLGTPIEVIAEITNLDKQVIEKL